MIKLISQYDKNSPKIEIKIHSDSSLTDVITQFEGFLKAVGYVFDGQLDLIHETKSDTN